MKDLPRLAELIRQRNALCNEITQIAGRPALIGHVGEYIAARVFGITMESSAVNKGFDGRFINGDLQGKSVNVKWYAKKEGCLDIRTDAVPDYYLVLTGPTAKALHSRGEDRPWLIESAFLFEAAALITHLQSKQLKLGIATSVAKELWNDAELFPRARSRTILLTTAQCAMLSQFSSSQCVPQLLVS